MGVLCRETVVEYILREDSGGFGLSHRAVKADCPYGTPESVCLSVAVGYQFLQEVVETFCSKED